MAIDNHISWLNSSNILNSMEGIKLKIMSQFNKDVELLFKNPILKFITSEKNYFYAKCKYFNCCLEFANESKFFKFIESKEPSINTTQTFLEIYSFDSITVSENYKIKEYAELMNADNLFKDIECSKVCKILVPIQYLYSLKFSNRFVNNYKNNENYERCLKNISSAFCISCPLFLLNGLPCIGRVISLLPLATEYSIYSYGDSSNVNQQTSSIMSCLDLDWSDKRIKYIIIYKTLSDEEYELILKILSTNMMKGYIKEIKLTTKNLSQLIDLAYICIECYNAEYINLQFETEDIEDKQDLIDDIQRRFQRKLKISNVYNRNF